LLKKFKADGYFHNASVWSFDTKVENPVKTALVSGRLARLQEAGSGATEPQ
jgi:hypothetical protein